MCSSLMRVKLGKCEVSISGSLKQTPLLSARPQAAEACRPETPPHAPFSTVYLHHLFLAATSGGDHQAGEHGPRLAAHPQRRLVPVSMVVNEALNVGVRP
eukprot:CAMPEP_0206140594 /NCGR_PEP_ID=MMETSP1473-20131121/9987_1 /ASSEMBLY_ACC=CAM_ASM_001109 /TAXON_ID=1461547 /ORGANISM="Stichococcus sp, Strain RCC1054" /LENGTH=99 /DNA_ID=CAMNT_0053534793 /DNA_START=72 /DNA_END=372 /DNA_ORIENTATION=-